MSINYEMLRYFWREKEDLERYLKWENELPELTKKHPEVVKAWNDYKIAKKILSIVINNLTEEDEEE